MANNQTNKPINETIAESLIRISTMGESRDKKVDLTTLKSNTEVSAGEVNYKGTAVLDLIKRADEMSGWDIETELNDNPITSDTADPQDGEDVFPNDIETSTFNVYFIPKTEKFYSIISVKAEYGNVDTLDGYELVKWKFDGKDVRILEIISNVKEDLEPKAPHIYLMQ